jgi:hypothetical protein
MSRYRQIVVHAGLSKTGSTSIQANCLRHRELLQHYGIEYPVFDYAGIAFDNHSTALITAISRSPGKYGLGLRRQYGDEAAELVTHCRAQLNERLSAAHSDTLLLSSERIAGLDDEDMQALRTRLEQHTQQLRVIVYIRSPQSALESILQERVKAGAVVDPQQIAGRVRRRYQALQRCFADVLEPVNYHEALACPGGIVGSFMSLLGISPQDIQAREFQSLNTRISLEAFVLMDAVNRRYPKRRQGEHGVKRSPGDLNPLLALPGQVFQIPEFEGSAAHSATLEEARWLESRLGFRFPAEVRPQLQALWPQESLASLEQLVDQIDSPQIRRLLAQVITAQADPLAQTRPGTARALLAIGENLERSAHGITPEGL